MSAQKILVVEDHRDTRELLKYNLTAAGFDVAAAEDGQLGLNLAHAFKPDILLLDLMMPGTDGLEVCRQLKGDPATARIPVIMLTAKGEDTDRIVGLELGADDYMAKPFNPRELLARIKAVLRRVRGCEERRTDATTIHAGGLVLNLSRQVLTIGRDEIELAPTECRLLKALMAHADRALTRDELMDMVWDKDFAAYDRSIDVHISKLRSQLKPYPAHAKRIRTVWGTGYMFVGD